MSLEAVFESVPLVFRFILLLALFFFWIAYGRACLWLWIITTSDPHAKKEIPWPKEFLLSILWPVQLILWLYLGFRYHSPFFRSKPPMNNHLS